MEDAGEPVAAFAVDEDGIDRYEARLVVEHRRRRYALGASAALGIVSIASGMAMQGIGPVDGARSDRVTFSPPASAHEATTAHGAGASREAQAAEALTPRRRALPTPRRPETPSTRALPPRAPKSYTVPRTRRATSDDPYVDPPAAPARPSKPRRAKSGEPYD